MSRLMSVHLLAVSGVLAGVVVACATPLAAQDPEVPASTLAELAGRVVPGDRVEVTTAPGFEQRGAVESVDERALRIRTGSGIREFGESGLLEVRRQGDRLWDGALIGGGVGFLIGGAAGTIDCSGDTAFCFGTVGLAIGLPIGAVLGWLVDRSWADRDVLYSGAQQASRWTVRPVIGGETRGVRFALRF